MDLDTSSIASQLYLETIHRHQLHHHIFRDIPAIPRRLRGGSSCLMIPSPNNKTCQSRPMQGFSGHHIRNKGKIKPVEGIISAFKNYQQPTSKKMLSIPGCNWVLLEIYIKGYTSTAVPLYLLLKKDAPDKFQLSSKQKQAFSNLKAALLSESTLTAPDHSKTFQC